jgi:hypothetical protein
MKFRILSSKERKRVKVANMRTPHMWQLVFLWLPTRTSPTEVQWLCRVARRNLGTATLSEQVERVFTATERPFAGWEYGHLTNVLTQPETQYADSTIGQQVGVDPSPSSANFIGSRLSSAQAGCAVIPGGHSNTLGGGS